MTSDPRPSHQTDPRVDHYIDARSSPSVTRSARMVSFYCGDSIESALTAMLKQLVAHIRAGGWRKIKARRTRG